jgi:hypothetical protein
LGPRNVAKQVHQLLHILSKDWIIARADVHAVMAASETRENTREFRFVSRYLCDDLLSVHDIHHFSILAATIRPSWKQAESDLPTYSSSLFSL